MLSCAPIQGHIAGLVDVSLSPLPKAFDVPIDLWLTNLDSKRLHHARPPDGYLRLRHLPHRACEEDRYGDLCVCEYIVCFRRKGRMNECTSEQQTYFLMIHISENLLKG